MFQIVFQHGRPFMLLNKVGYCISRYFQKLRQHSANLQGMVTQAHVFTMLKIPEYTFPSQGLC